MRFLALIFKIILFALLLGFAAKNSEKVSLRYFMGMDWQVPLSLLMLIVFSIGLVMGVLACSSRLLKGRSRSGLPKDKRGKVETQAREN